MYYMLLIYIDEKTLGDSERERCYMQSAEFAHELAANGRYVAASPLYATATAKSLRLNSGKAIVTDGPFAETREQLGGYFVVDAKDMDEALDIAARLPAARFGTVEVRPMITVPTLPPEPASAGVLSFNSKN